MIRNPIFFTAGCLLAAAVATAEPHFHPSPFGIMGFPYSHAHSAADPFGDAEKHMKLYKLTGARWDRRDFWWGLVEPEPGHWEWEYFDRSIQDFRDHRVNLVVILCYGSAWEEGAPSTEKSIEAYGDYVFQMVSRYKDWVKHWEVWNEPNILPFWQPKPDVEAYTKLLRTAYARAKEADPDCVVIGGALAGADARFLRGMYTHGARGHFDALSYHTYGNNPTEESQQREIDMLRTVMEENRDVKPLWLTETGIYTGPAGVDEETQARRIVQSQTRWVAMGVERTFQLTLKDWSGDAEAVDAMGFRGVANADGTAKKSFHAFRTQNDMIGTLAPVGRPRLAPGLHSYLFGDGDRHVLVAWADEGVSLELELNLDATHVLKVDLYGERELLHAEDRVYTMTVGQDPVYIEGVGPLLEEAARWILELDPPHLTPGGSGTVTLTPPDGSTASASLQKGVGYRFLDAHTITADEETAPGVLHVEWELVRGMRSLRLHQPLKVVSPLTLDSEPWNVYTPNNPSVPVVAANRSTGEIAGTLSWSWEPRVGVEASERVAVAGGETHVQQIPAPLKEMLNGTVYTLSAELASTAGTLRYSKPLRFLQVPRIDFNVEIDGDLSEWGTVPRNIRADMLRIESFNPALAGGAEDLSASGWLAWDAEALYFALEVRDNTIHLPINTVVWDFDSLQIAFDGLNDARPDEGFNENDYEIQVARLRDGSTMVYAGHYPEGFISSVVSDMTETAITVDEESGVIIYEMRIPSAVLPSIDLATGRAFGFNFIHNDNDTGGPTDRKGWLELTPGIGYGKDPHLYFDAILWPDSNINNPQEEQSK